MTDGGRTDGRAIAYTRYSIYAVVRKNGIALQLCSLSLLMVVVSGNVD